MKFRVTAIAVGAVAAALLTISPASAQAAGRNYYDHKDPYTTGCGNAAKVVRTGSLSNRIDGKVGTIQLWWSGRCKTNWIEIRTASSAHGTISVYTDKGYDRFSFKQGNGGRHWGNMMYGNNMCAWGSASVVFGSGRGGQNGSGGTTKACG
ncbi:DUF2690 domain-containing protein [Nonomuraea aurantiaca]|uniref:DUF2690 domain-containing protein n=1 Tax=Nonomuraea aurantiaca TaxID=2878562 RepID=UPI001CDA0C5D|nr:DUF2690 domain-containing protein [Nonomuraea aurantiaca]MCA2225529.1 YjfA family protein [Nonomuraea aurantiaca]